MNLHNHPAVLKRSATVAGILAQPGSSRGPAPPTTAAIGAGEKEQKLLGAVAASNDAPQAAAAEGKFQPSITTKAQKRKPRSAWEMCYGDAQRKEEHQKEVQAKLDEEAKKIFPFKPKVLEKAPNGRIRPLEKDYMQRLVKDQESKEEKRLQKIQAQTEESLKECLFKPQLLTAGCPDYVKRMAESHRLFRDWQEKENRRIQAEEGRAPERPEWRS